MAIHSNSGSNSSATKSQHRTARSNRQGVRAEGGAERHQASALAPPRRCLPPCPHAMWPSDARSAAAAPWAPPYGRGKARRRRTGAPERPTPRCGGSSRASPTLAPCPPCARVPSDRHAQPSAEPADGSQLAPPPPPARGATAPSSLPSPIRCCGPDQKHYSGIAPSSERIASGCTKQAQSHLQLY